MINYFIKDNGDGTTSYGREDTNGERYSLTIEPNMGNGKGFTLIGVDDFNGWDISTEQDFFDQKARADQYYDLLVP